jgi:hypothetical protein
MAKFLVSVILERKFEEGDRERNRAVMVSISLTRELFDGHDQHLQRSRARICLT